MLIALDGTEYFCSQKLECSCCSSRNRAYGKSEHFHSMFSAAVVTMVVEYYMRKRNPAPVEMPRRYGE